MPGVQLIVYNWILRTKTIRTSSQREEWEGHSCYRVRLGATRFSCIHGIDTDLTFAPESYLLNIRVGSGFGSALFAHFESHKNLKKKTFQLHNFIHVLISFYTCFKLYIKLSCNLFTNKREINYISHCQFFICLLY